MVSKIPHAVAAGRVSSRSTNSPEIVYSLLPQSELAAIWFTGIHEQDRHPMSIALCMEDLGEMQ